MSLAFSIIGNFGGINLYDPDITDEEREICSHINDLAHEIHNTDYNPFRSFNGNNILTKIWLKLLKDATDAPYTNIRTNTRTAAYNNADIRHWTTAPEQYTPRGNIYNEIDRRDTLHISFAHIKRGLGIFDVLQANAEAYNLTLMPALTMHLIRDRYHKIAVYQTTNGVLVVTNQYSEEMYIKLMSCVWSQFNTHDISTSLADKTPDTCDFLKFCAMLYNSDFTAYEAYLNEINAAVQAEANNPDRIKQELLAFQERVSSNQHQTLKTEINNIENTLEDLTERILVLQTTKRDRELDLIRLTILNEKNNPAMEALFAMIQRSNGNISLIGVDPDCNTNLLFTITTPINSYRIKDVEVFFKPNANTNMFTKDKHVALAVRKTFIDEEYLLMTKTKISIAFNSDSVTRARYSMPNNNFIQNTHMEHYNCFSSARTASQKCILHQDYVGAVAQIIMACGTLTFTDGTVMTRFAESLKNNKTKKFFLEKATGNLVSIHDIWNKENTDSVPEQDNDSETQATIDF